MNKKHDKQKVLKHGYDLFWTKGYASLGVDEICKSTGMTKGAFYNAFKSKENFLLEGLKEYGKASECAQKELLKSSGSKAIERLQGLYDGLFDIQSKMDNRGCLVINMMSEMSIQNEIVRKATLAEFNNFIKTIQPTVREAQQDRDLRGDFDSKTLTELVHTTFLGALIRNKGLRSNKEGKKAMSLLIKSLSP